MAVSTFGRCDRDARREHLWSPIDYLNPTYTFSEARSSLTPKLTAALVLWTLPFLWIGASMTMRRAVDAGRSAWVGLLFFVRSSTTC